MGSTSPPAPNGFLHAATVIAPADTSCGYGTVANLPQGESGFTTIELKPDFCCTQMILRQKA